LERGVRPQRRQVLVAGDLAEADDRETDWLDAHSGRGWWCVEVTLPGASAARCGDRLGIGTFRAGGASGFAELVRHNMQGKRRSCGTAVGHLRARGDACR